MNTIWKYHLNYNEQTFKMPKGAKILTMQTQNGYPVMWAMVDTKAEKEERFFNLIGTGQPISTAVSHSYIGTCQRFGGQEVLHLFEVIQE